MVVSVYILFIINASVQVERYKQEVEKMTAEMEHLENQNLKIMSELLECNTDDLKLSKLAVKFCFR